MAHATRFTAASVVMIVTCSAGRVLAAENVFTHNDDLLHDRVAAGAAQGYNRHLCRRKTFSNRNSKKPQPRPYLVPNPRPLPTLIHCNYHHQPPPQIPPSDNLWQGAFAWTCYTSGHRRTDGKYNVLRKPNQTWIHKLRLPMFVAEPDVISTTSDELSIMIADLNASTDFNTAADDEPTALEVYSQSLLRQSTMFALRTELTFHPLLSNMLRPN